MAEDLDFTKDVLRDKDVTEKFDASVAAAKAVDSSIKAGQTSEQVSKLQATLNRANIDYINAINDKAVEKNFFTKDQMEEIKNKITPDSLENGILDNVDSNSNTALGKWKKFVVEDPLSKLQEWIDKANQTYTQGWFSKNKDKILEKLGSSATELLASALRYAAIGGLAYWFLHTVQNEMTGCYQSNLVAGGTPIRVGDGVCSQQTCMCPMKQEGANMPCASPPCQDGTGKQVYNYNWQNPTLFDTICNMLRTATAAIGGGLDDILAPLKTYLMWAGIAILVIIGLYIIYKLISLFLERPSSHAFRMMFKSRRRPHRLKNF